MNSVSARQALPVGILLLLLFRLWFSAALPMSGDEAYFVLWGAHPAGGYYDHPPMVGWWLSGLLALSRAEWVLRLPSTLLPLLLAGGAWWLVRPCGEARARWAALLVLLQPAQVWNVLITTDTPAICFSWLSILAYASGVRSARRGVALGWHFAAGLLLGLAFLGKYFAALIGLGYLAHLVLFRRDAGRLGQFLVLLLAALPALAYNLWWNSQHCWVNIVFNFFSRNESAGFAWSNPPLYLLSVAYLATPWLLWALLRPGRAVAASAPPQREAIRLAGVLAGVPLAIFALLSLAKTVGLHWLLTFVPLLAVVGAAGLSEARLVRLVRWSAWLAGAHVLLFAIAVLLPATVWQKTRIGEGMALRAHIGEIRRQLALLPPDTLLAHASYSTGAYLAYAAERPVALFGRGSVYGRQDDFLTDWKAHDGGQVALISATPPREDEILPYFRHVEFRSVDVGGLPLHLALGSGFDYAAYHDKVLRSVRERYYRRPVWLPACACAFEDRYFSEPDGTR